MLHKLVRGERDNRSEAIADLKHAFNGILVFVCVQFPVGDGRGAIDFRTSGGKRLDDRL